MSALRFVAWGAVIVDGNMPREEQDKIKKEIRRELEPHGLVLGGARSNVRSPVYHSHMRGALRPPTRTFQLLRVDRTRHRRAISIKSGTLKECCAAALKIIEPDNYSEG